MKWLIKIPVALALYIIKLFGYGLVGVVIGFVILGIRAVAGV